MQELRRPTAVERLCIDSRPILNLGLGQAKSVHSRVRRGHLRADKELNPALAWRVNRRHTRSPRSRSNCVYYIFLFHVALMWCSWWKYNSCLFMNNAVFCHQSYGIFMLLTSENARSWTWHIDVAPQSRLPRWAARTSPCNWRKAQFRTAARHPKFCFFFWQ